MVGPPMHPGRLRCYPGELPGRSLAIPRTARWQRSPYGGPGFRPREIPRGPCGGLRSGGYLFVAGEQRMQVLARPSPPWQRPPPSPARNSEAPAATPSAEKTHFRKPPAAAASWRSTVGNSASVALTGCVSVKAGVRRGCKRLPEFRCAKSGPCLATARKEHLPHSRRSALPRGHAGSYRNRRDPFQRGTATVSGSKSDPHVAAHEGGSRASMRRTNRRAAWPPRAATLLPLSALAIFCFICTFRPTSRWLFAMALLCSELGCPAGAGVAGGSEGGAGRK